MVENTNTGAVLGAGKVRRAYAQVKGRVLGKLGVPGYQPYERIGLWLRRELAGAVRKTLLSESCLDRGHRWLLEESFNRDERSQNQLAAVR
jgi:hypothetical protein